MNKKFFPVVLVIVFVSGCRSGEIQELASTETAVSTATQTLLPSPTSSRLPVTPTPKNMSTPTPPIITSKTNPVFIGTPQGEALEPINADNIENLSMVAQWGKGNILDVAFAPDGNTFVVGSALGIAIYDINDLSSPPRWVPFDVPFAFDNFYISGNGQYLLLTSGPYIGWGPAYNTTGDQKIVELLTGQWVEDQIDVDWFAPERGEADYGAVSLISPDGSMEFKSFLSYSGDRLEEELLEKDITEISEEVSVREVYSYPAEELLYTLSDEVPPVTMDDRSEPEGCDIDYFSPCGNALMASASAPYEVAFSPSGKTFTVLYRSPNHYYTPWFSTLRVYNSEDGKLLEVIGSFDQPAVDFAYAPEGEKILVAYLEGSIQLYDIDKGKFTYGSWHFNGPIDYLTYSQDGQYLLIQRWKTLEVRRTRDGSLLGRYESTAFAASPTENIMAIGSKDGHIRIRDIATGQNIRHLIGHTKRIFSLAFSPDGRLLASSSQDCSARLWSVFSGGLMYYLAENLAHPYDENWSSRIFVYYLEFVPETNQLIGFGSWGSMASWQVDSGATKYFVESAPLEYYQGMITIQPHFPEYFVADVEGSRFFINNVTYDLDTGKVIGEYQPPENQPEGCVYPGPITADGRYMLTRGYDKREGQICVLDSEDLSLEMTIEVVPAEASDDMTIDWLYLSPDSKQLILDTYSGIVYVYQIIP